MIVLLGLNDPEGSLGDKGFGACMLDVQSIFYTVLMNGGEEKNR
jgi:hypothetical protein